MYRAVYIGLLLSLVIQHTLCAEDKALIIGVGKYEDPTINLPGIDLDVNRTVRVAHTLGLEDKQIHVLQDRDATLSAIEHELTTWFREGVTARDRLLLYFSCHGSLVSEGGRTVAVLVPHDVRVGAGLQNVLSGPRLASMLAENPSKNIIVVIDACHSGGLTQGKGIGVDRFVPKVLRYPGMPTSTPDVTLFETSVTKDAMGPGANYAIISACRREEVAAATKQGSVLTIGLERGLTELRGRKAAASLAAVQPITLSFIQSLHINQQNPEVFGAPALLDQDWFSTQRQGAGQTPTRWALLEEIAHGAQGTLPVRISKQEYLKGDQMAIDVDTPKSGFLKIVSLGEGDERASILYPNGWDQEGQVEGGTVRIPKAGAGWHISQGLPSGYSTQQVMLVVVFSENPIDLSRHLSGEGSFKEYEVTGDSKTPFDEADSTGGGYWATKLMFVIKER